jgi:hypothetical protein
MIPLLTLFTPAFLLVTISKLLWRWFFPRHRRWQRTFPRQYYLRMWLLNAQVSWTRTLNLAFLQRFVASLHQHQIWIWDGNTSFSLRRERLGGIDQLSIFYKSQLWTILPKYQERNYLFPQL